MRLRDLTLIGTVVRAMAVMLLCAARLAAAPSAAQLAADDRAFEDPQSTPAKSVLTTEDEKFLDDLEHRGIQFFLDQADPVTGLMADRAGADGGRKDVASIASVGFGLTALCIGDGRGCYVAVWTLASAAARGSGPVDSCDGRGDHHG